MNQALSSQAETIRVAAPTGTQAVRLLLTLAVALGLGGLVIWQLRQDWTRDQLWPWLSLLVVMFAAAYALRRLELWLPGSPLLPRLAGFRSWPLRLFGLFEIVIALALAGLATWRLWPDFRNKWQDALPIWIAALLLFLFGAWLVGAVGRGSPRAAAALSLWPDTRRNRWLEAAAFALILALAILLRAYRLDAIPPGIYIDETTGALDALYILEGRPDSPFGTGWYGTPNGYLYYMAAVFKLFGANWYSLKIVSLIPAILTVPAVYLLGRLMFGPLAGLSAMLLIAASRWHLSMSRWGWNETAPPLFQVLATFFLLRGLRDRRATDYALGGLLAGLSIYTYLSARMAIATLAIFILFWFFSDPSGWSASFQRSGGGIALMILGALIAAAPIGVTYVKDPFSLGNRAAEISILRDIREQGSLEPLAQNITDMLKFFHQTGDQQGKHNLPGEPMADPITGLLFAVGVAYALLARRDHRYFLLLLWLVLGLAGSFLSSQHESPQAYRSLTALPAVVLLAASILDHLARAAYRFLQEQAFNAERPWLPRWAAYGMVLLVLLSAAAWESSTYFGRQAASLEVVRGFNPTENGIAREVVPGLLAGKDVYLSPNFSQYSPLRFLVYGVMKSRMGKNTLDNGPYQVVLPEVNLPLPDYGRDVLILLDHDYWPLRDYLASFYPEAQMDLVSLADGTPLYLRMQVPQSQVAALQGLVATLSYADGKTEERVVPQVEWTAADSPASHGASQIVWEGALRLEHGGEYELHGEGGLEIFLDDLPMQGKHYLGRGLYQLRAVWEQEKGSRARLSWKPPGQAELSSIPPDALFRLGGFRSGLQGTFWANKNWEGAPAFQQVTPFLMLSWPDEQPIVPNGEFSARYTGLLQIAEAGPYLFVVEADDGARLILDGEVLGESLTPGQPNDVEATVELLPGEHTIQVDYFQQGGGSALRLLWAHGNDDLGPIPPDVLTPAEP